MCTVISCVVGSGCCYDQCVLLTNSVNLCPDSFVLQSQLACYSRYLLTSLFCIPVTYITYYEKDIIFCVLVREDLVGLHRIIQLLLLQLYW